MVEECVREIAKAYTTIRFVKLQYEEAEMEVAGVPAILAYRGGDKFAGLVPVVDEIPEDEELSARSLATVLERYIGPSHTHFVYLINNFTGTMFSRKQLAYPLLPLFLVV